mgnify:CR=1 FL=1
MNRREQKYDPMIMQSIQAQNAWMSQCIAINYGLLYRICHRKSRKMRSLQNSVNYQYCSVNEHNSTKYDHFISEGMRVTFHS